VHTKTKIDINNSNVRAACLPDDAVADSLEPFDKESLTVGWGRQSTNGAYLNQKTQVVLPMLSATRCDSLYMQYGFMSQYQCCAGYMINAGICNGDSGGPILINVNNLWYQVGISSWVIRCGDGSAFTRTDYNRQWIANSMWHSA